MINEFIISNTPSILVTLLLCAIYFFMPSVTRRDIFFGISVPPSEMDNQELLKLVSLHKRVIFLVIFPVSVLFYFVLFLLKIRIPFSGEIFFPLLGTSVLYLYLNSRVKKLKSSSSWGNSSSKTVIDTTYTYRSRSRNMLNPIWYTIPFLLICATAYLVYTNISVLPQSIPIHWNIWGQADAWVIKDSFSPYKVPIHLCILTILLLGVSVIIPLAKQNLRGDSPEVSVKKDLIFRKRMSLIIYILNIAIVSMTSIFYLSSLNIIYLPPVILKYISIIHMVLVGGILIIILFSGQGGRHIKVSTEKESDASYKNDDKHWKLGMLYVNRNDPSIFVEKRFGVGYTLNFGNIWSYLIIVSTVLLIILLTNI